MHEDTRIPTTGLALRTMAAAVALTAAAGAGGAVRGEAGEGGVAPPELLSRTGLYSDAADRRVAPDLVAFTPQYALWTDGASKRRWIALPPQAAVDASDPDDWQFPRGTRLWKEFSFGGRPVETRFMQRLADGTWLYAAYAWREDGTEADLVGPRGRRRAHPLGGGRFHAIPGTADRKACHEGRPSRVLGFSAIQLSGDRDPLAPHGETDGDAGADLARLTAAGVLAGLPDAVVRRPPRLPGDPVERAASGYLHGNCGHCHNERGTLANLGLAFWAPVEGRGAGAAPSVLSTVGVPARRLGSEHWTRIVPGDPDRSLVLDRASSRDPAWQMPPLGTTQPDLRALALLRDWVTRLNARENRRIVP